MSFEPQNGHGLYSIKPSSVVYPDVLRPMADEYAAFTEPGDKVGGNQLVQITVADIVEYSRGINHNALVICGEAEMEIQRLCVGREAAERIPPHDLV